MLGLSRSIAALAAAPPPDPDALSEREWRQWLMLTAQLYCFSSRRLRLRRSLRLRHRPPVAAP